jgi:hypothetical protein
MSRDALWTAGLLKERVAATWVELEQMEWLETFNLLQKGRSPKTKQERASDL